MSRLVLIVSTRRTSAVKNNIHEFFYQEKISFYVILYLGGGNTGLNKNENTVFCSLEIIEKRISEKLTVENIANSIYFSKCHYQRLFREIVGESVMEYVTKRKLTLAGKKLLETDASILDIALECGYNSHENFTRSFKQHIGVTPSEYRKYNLTAISQKIIKERSSMLNNKNIDEIIKELNEFIVKAKETAESARKIASSNQYFLYWNLIADKTVSYSDRIKKITEQITALSEYPDEITNRFTFIKVLEDIAFELNLMAFNVGLMASRSIPEFHDLQKPLCDKYIELARNSSIKVEKISKYLNELSSLIFDDMKKSASEKIQLIIKAGETAVNNLKGYSYIKEETEYILNEIKQTSQENITVSMFEEWQFKMNIIVFAADMDTFRNPSDKKMFEGLTQFKEIISEATDFFQTLVKPEKNHTTEHSTKRLLDIAFHGNVLHFYTKGEISYEKLGKSLNEQQKADFAKICDKINKFIQFTLNSTDESVYKEIANMLDSIYSDMAVEADKLNEKGSSVRFLANEFKKLSDAVKSITK